MMRESFLILPSSTRLTESEPEPKICTRSALSCVILSLTLAEERVSQCLEESEPHPARLMHSISSPERRECTRMLLPSSMLYLYHYCLFPAERMLVVAGSPSQHLNALLLTAAYDVTLEQENGPCPTSVRADPVKLISNPVEQ
jgi:hypothetical protein